MADHHRLEVFWTTRWKLDRKEIGSSMTSPNRRKTMKHTVLVIGAVLLAAGMAYGQTETPGIDQRQANQEQRIDQGIASGQLTQHETNRLEKQQHHIDNMENKAKSDGVMTRKERARIHAAQDKASKKIYRQK